MFRSVVTLVPVAHGGWGWWARLGEALWLEALEDEENFEDRKAGGQNRRKAVEQAALASIGAADPLGHYN